MRGLVCAVLLASIACGTEGAAAEFGRQEFKDSRNPPPLKALISDQQDRFDLGHAIFNTQFVPAGTEGAARRDGLGPLFNAAACDACHNEGAHGRGPTGNGLLPASVVVQLSGDVSYGRTFNTAAIAGCVPEGQVAVTFIERSGRYPDGESWHLRVPQYVFSDLAHGPLEAHTIVEPRIAPALFGVGLLAAVAPEAAGRFGWQGSTKTVREQTARAFSRDMGLTNPVVATDDCTALEVACRGAPSGGDPEISEEFLADVVEFQEMLAVPAALSLPESIAMPMRKLFAQLGCASCHQPTQAAKVQGRPDPAVTIGPYSDLRLHELGVDLDDRRVDGRPVATRFRTAPLWGMGYRLQHEMFPTFLHDGRARSLEEAILWHGGEAEKARRRFEATVALSRDALLRWLATL